MYLVKSGISAIESSKRNDILLSINQYLKSVEASKNKDQVIYSPQYFIPDLNDWTLVKESILSKNLEINKLNRDPIAKIIRASEGFM